MGSCWFIVFWCFLGFFRCLLVERRYFLRGLGVVVFGGVGLKGGTRNGRYIYVIVSVFFM